MISKSLQARNRATGIGLSLFAASVFGWVIMRLSGHDRFDTDEVRALQAAAVKATSADPARQPNA